MIKKESDKFSDSNVLEGMTSIDALIKAKERGINDRPIVKVLYCIEKESSKRREISYLKRKASALSFDIEAVPASVIDDMTIGNTHGGIIAVCGERSFAVLTKDKIAKKGFYVLIEGIEDPYNFGYSLRSLYAAGVDGIILTKRNWMGCAGVVSRASAGASELFPMFVCDPVEAICVFKSVGYKIVCAEKENSESVYKTELKKPLFLIVGGEKRGISAAVLSEADKRVHIDYGRDFPLALSSASASAIIAFEIMRQNM